jgi:1-phosphofructokinase
VLAGGGTVVEAVTLGAAAGAQNVTRHGLGTGDPGTIERLRELVVMRPLPDEQDAGAPPAREVTPDELARGIEEVDA